MDEETKQKLATKAKYLAEGTFPLYWSTLTFRQKYTVYFWTVMNTILWLFGLKKDERK
jgi:hypothetical protein